MVTVDCYGPLDLLLLARALELPGSVSFEAGCNLPEDIAVNGYVY